VWDVNFLQGNLALRLSLSSSLKRLHLRSNKEQFDTTVRHEGLDYLLITSMSECGALD
jgi:hypothetical protein